MLPVWYIITRGADDSINTPRIGNILATSCFYSGSHYVYLHRVVIACARLNEKKIKTTQRNEEEDEVCDRVLLWNGVGISIQNEWHWQRHRCFYSRFPIKSEKTMHFAFHCTEIPGCCLGIYLKIWTWILPHTQISNLHTIFNECVSIKHKQFLGN